MLKTGNNDHGMGVTMVSSVCELFETCQFPKTMLEGVHKVLLLYLMIPLSSATAERAFSSLRRLKSYLRSTMTQKQLNHVVFLNTHKDRVDQMCIVDIAKQFISRKQTHTF